MLLQKIQAKAFLRALPFPIYTRRTVLHHTPIPSCKEHHIFRIGKFMIIN